MTLPTAPPLQVKITLHRQMPEFLELVVALPEALTPAELTELADRLYEALPEDAGWTRNPFELGSPALPKLGDVEPRTDVLADFTLDDNDWSLTPAPHFAEGGGECPTPRQPAPPDATP